MAGRTRTRQPGAPRMDSIDGRRARAPARVSSFGGAASEDRSRRLWENAIGSRAVRHACCRDGKIAGRAQSGPLLSAKKETPRSSGFRLLKMLGRTCRANAAERGAAIVFELENGFRAALGARDPSLRSVEKGANDRRSMLKGPGAHLACKFAEVPPHAAAGRDADELGHGHATLDAAAAAGPVSLAHASRSGRRAGQLAPCPSRRRKGFRAVRFEASSPSQP